jgi:hypothetical protein
MTKIDPALLLEALTYFPDTGKFMWRIRPETHFSSDAKWSAADACKRWNNRYASTEAFVTPSTKAKYLTGVIFNKRLLAHRVAWAMSNGSWPTETIDHKNGVRSDNRLANLRQASRQEQSRNTSSAHNSTSKFLGVSFRKDREKWRANIFISGRQTSLGSFLSEIEAAIMYDAAAKKHYGEFARLNFP